MKARLRRPHRLSEKLSRPASSSFPEGDSPPRGAFAEGASLPTERVRALARDPQAGSVVFQSVAVAAFRTLDRVLHHERQAAAAALSLAQQEKLEAMAGSLEAVMRALRETLSAQGAKALDLHATALPDEPEEHFWWFALTETIQVLEKAIAWTASMVHGQPKGGPARTLSSVVARLLRTHHHTLLAEAEDWMS